MKTLKLKADSIKNISVDEIFEDENQPRSFMVKEGLESLAESLKMLGVLSPLVVEKVLDGYKVLDGHRRLAASKMAGLAVVPCIITTMAKLQLSSYAVVVNTLRENLNQMDLAKAWKFLSEEKGLTLEAIGKMHGCSKSWVSQVTSILEMDEPIRSAIEAGLLDVPKARILWRVIDDKKRFVMLHDILESGASYRVVCSWVQQEMSRTLPERDLPTGVPPTDFPATAPSLTYPCFWCGKEFSGNALTSVLMCPEDRTNLTKVVQEMREKDEGK
jgi:ParB/RepB/Spo0J family partition protein